MVDFKKRLGFRAIEKKINPVEIYDELDRRSETGPLRPVQQQVLAEWWSNRKEDKDLILKLHTGQGKTLIGLLMLQSQLNQKKGPCLYVCPNKYLVEQTCQEAEKFGIGYVKIGPDNSLPEEFLSSEKILITHIQKFFNGKSIFGIGGKFVTVNTIILDDSHACIDFIKKSFKIVLKKEHELYLKILNLFKQDLNKQGEGRLFEIQNGSGENTSIPVPYWSWEDKKQEIIAFLGEYNEDKDITFTWPLIKDRIGNCQCIISGREIEISPFVSLIHEFRSFGQARHRILMSATTQNDSFFIKGFGLSVESVKNPLTHKYEKWWGEKMILIPSLIRDDLDKNKIIPRFAQSKETREVGIVVITSSFKKAKLYENNGAVICKTEDIFERVNQLKNGHDYSKTIVFVNRYDGIDLPDDSCRLLIMDSLPYANSLSDKYEEECRSNSDFINIQIAQRIEQGMGRSVRGEKDYSVIILLGKDLIKFVKSSLTNKFFSSQTRKQIEIGLEIANIVNEDNSEQPQSPKNQSLHILQELMKQCVARDEGWKEFYREKMNDVNQDENFYQSQEIDILSLEKKAADSFYKNDAESAVKYIQQLIDSYCQDRTDDDDDDEKAWYLQILARYKYTLSKVDANKIQKSAYQKNQRLLKPQDGITYEKTNYINDGRIKKIKTWIMSDPSYEQLMLKVEAMLDDLSFGQPSEKFERALQDLGKAIGFQSKRPDREFKTGPDNLWCVENNDYFIFECKSEVDDNRREIIKTETGQMNNHCAWFEQEYKTARVKTILIIPTNKVASNANFTHEVTIMKRNKLESLKNSVKGFFKEIKDYKIPELSDAKIQEWLLVHKLDLKSLKTHYTESYYPKK
ncbi:DEAD/DEAH box helicase [Oscillatoria acuminata]|uniref:Superfamily II helicase n=1 Tax=Oscillatoria acuminata PCC 6304 TaxID=56110 RepID=K9TKK0_9CYAN|nr:DEAD/DEAH box helicase family protein [Oscillatoria acuminata]AFY83070.1 superfamily II helicase [Oscillatoria acuminata PCC 6304]